MSKTSETGGLRPLEPPGTAVALVLSIGLGLAIGLLASEYRAWKQVKSLEAQETVAGEARWECVMTLAGKTGARIEAARGSGDSSREALAGMLRELGVEREGEEETGAEALNSCPFRGIIH